MSAPPTSPVPATGRRPGPSGAVPVTTGATAPATIDLLSAIPTPTGALSFVCEGDGLVGWGTYARFSVTGPDAAERIGRWWAGQCAGFRVDDQVRLPGSGPLVFVSLGFTAADESVAVIPRVVLGNRDGARFTTVIGEPSAAALPAADPVRGPATVDYRPGAFPPDAYQDAVRRAVARIATGEVEKVVLACDLRAETGQRIDERFLLSRLAAAYPSCMTFAVDGLVGATPELLVRRHGRRISSRVLAGTGWPERSGEHTAGVVATNLLASDKDITEHRYAVDSVADALRGIAEDVRVPRTPHALPLANLTHLVTDITARLPAHAPRTADSPTSALALAARLHPTAAVGGTPRDAAVRLLTELEPTPRGRYAAPVGWLDAAGNGEFGLALRCARLDATGATLVAGCGIVADSDPAKELREAQVKMLPIRDALAG